MFRTKNALVVLLVALLACFALGGCLSDTGQGKARDDEDNTGSIEQADTSGTMTLIQGSSGQSGYDFSAQAYHGNSGGDFYAVGGQFWANNLGQRGVVQIGACSSVNAITTIPLTGYSLFGVNATAATCYAALTHNDERDNILFRVDSISGNLLQISWRLIISGNYGATLSSGSPTQGGYDFSTRTYQGLSGGDFYFLYPQFWANNAGQRGVVSAGPCTTVSDVKTVPQSGYSLFGVTAVAGNCYVALTHNEEHQNIVFRVDSLGNPNTSITWKLVDDCYGLTDPRGNVNCWLSSTSAVAQYVEWENRVATGSTQVLPWSQWPNTKRDDLRTNVANYESLLKQTITQDPDPLTDPPTNQETLQDSEFPVLVLSFNDAWRLYVKTIAMSLAVEMNGYVAWSVTSYGNTSLMALFDSRKLFSYTWSGRPANLGVPTPASEGYMLVSNAWDPVNHTTFTPTAAFALPAPPDKALQFTNDKALKGATRLATITNALTWAEHLYHWSAVQTTAAFQSAWQYRGPAPVSRTIATTTDTSFNPNARHYTAGCHGTSGFLNSILRALNIPVDSNVSSGHSHTRFMTEALTLSHGDDPYIGFDIYGGPSSALLISDATYAAWFTNVSPALAAENIGRGDTESLIHYLSPELEFSYCLDPVPGADHPHSKIMSIGDIASHPSVYTVSYLENLPPDPTNPTLPPSLWDRLGQKIAVNGGCTSTMATISAQKIAAAAVMPVSEQLDYNW